MIKAIAVITGDIINSRSDVRAAWMGNLKPFFQQFGNSPADWEIYRGDEFQFRVPLKMALKIAIQIKALIKQQEALDVRLGIGLGDEKVRTERVGESNGSAYQRSGEAFNAISEHAVNMQIATGQPMYDQGLNLMLALALDFMDEWSVVSAEIMALVLAQPDITQAEWARRLNINQSAVSQRLKRARYELVEQLLAYFEQTCKAQIP